MLTRWSIVNNQRLAAVGSWLEGLLGAGFFPSPESLARNPSHPPPCTKPRESEQAREAPFFTYFLFQNVALFRNFLLKFWKALGHNPSYLPQSLAGVSYPSRVGDQNTRAYQCWFIQRSM
jgi:hypothetical protein